MSGLHFNSECKAYKHLRDFFAKHLLIHKEPNSESEYPNACGIFHGEH